MSIRNRIQDAEVLWKHGRKEGAWVLALIAAAATSRKRYPKPTKDGTAFKDFIRDVMFTIVTGETLRAAGSPRIVFHQTPVEDIFYEHLRCTLVHEGQISCQIAFSESKVTDGRLVAELTIGTPNVIPDFWVCNLMKAVREAPENTSEFLPACE